MIKIEHIAIWAKDLEKLKDFYIKYFGAESNDKYINSQKSFHSYFLSFGGETRLEIMQMPNIPESKNSYMDQFLGIIHIAISVGSETGVIELTEQLREDGYIIVGEPRKTGDGYFESVVLDPENNRIEITS